MIRRVLAGANSVGCPPLLDVLLECPVHVTRRWRRGVAPNMTQEFVPGPHGEVVVYTAPDGAVRVDVRLERDSVWLT